jgi:hypothetical protein
MSKHNHPLEQEELMAYLDGELSADRATVAVGHLEHCPECQTLAADLRDVSQKLMAWEVESPDARIRPEITAALDQRDHKPEGLAISNRSNWRDRFTLPRIMPWAGWIAAGSLALLVSMSPLYRMGTRENALRHFAAPASPAGLSSPVTPGGGGNGQPTTDQQSKAFANGTSIPGPMIIRTAALALTTRDFDKARASVEEVLHRHRGYIGEMNVNAPVGAGRSFTATLRIPADQLDAAMADLRKLGRVESESQGGQDVTSQYVDLEARLSNEKNTERRLTDLLLQRTGKLSDVLAVENEISRVRGEIERMEAERKNLSNQVDFATITTTVSEDYQAQLQVVPTSTFGRIRNAAVEGYRTMIEGIVNVVLFFFSFGPSLLLWCAVLFFPARAVWRKLHQARAP